MSSFASSRNFHWIQRKLARTAVARGRIGDHYRRWVWLSVAFLGDSSPITCNQLQIGRLWLFVIKFQKSKSGHEPIKSWEITRIGKLSRSTSISGYLLCKSCGEDSTILNLVDNSRISAFNLGLSNYTFGSKEILLQDLRNPRGINFKVLITKRASCAKTTGVSFLVYLSIPSIVINFLLPVDFCSIVVRRIRLENLSVSFL